MSNREFHHLLESLAALSPEQLATLRRELDSKTAASPPAGADRAGPETEETVFDRLNRAGLIGCIKGRPHSPTDLSTNRQHMEGFGGG